MRKPDIQGLIKLARFLRKLPKSKYDQETWVEKRRCGTKACLAGWASFVFPARFTREPWFQSHQWTMYNVKCRRTHHIGPRAFADGFHISYNDASDLCEGSASHQTPKQAAKAIDKLVARLKKEKHA